jgi:hypothetical protein
MSQARVCSEIISRAAKIVGGEQALAQLLHQDLEDIKAWTQGSRLAPLDVYIKALDLLCDSRKKRSP